jgi:hypothetical protein
MDSDSIAKVTVDAANRNRDGAAHVLKLKIRRMNHLSFPDIRMLVLVMLIVWVAPSALVTRFEAQSAAIQQSDVYVCPMHPDVESKSPGKCPRCGMSLIRKSSSTPGEYQVILRATPTAIHAGEKLQLRFLIFNPQSHELVREFNIVHDKPFHLFIVSQDLAHFQHIHPIQQLDGSFIAETVLPRAAAYKVFCDFFPVGGTPQLVRKSLITVGFNKNTPFKQGNLVPDQTLTKSVDGIRFDLTINPAELAEAKLAHLIYYLVDEKLDRPVNDLQPYLGAWGHTFILSEDTTQYLHVHPEDPISQDIDPNKPASQPYVSFETFFPKPGRYRIWSEFQHQDRVTTVSFTVYVSPLNKVARWNGKQWSILPGTSTNDLKRTVHAIAVNGRDVYVGGDFTSIGGVSARRIAHWDGHRWTALGSGLDDGIVHAIAVSGSDVYVGGTFTTAGGVRVNRIAKWDGRAWSALGQGISGCTDSYCSSTVYAIGVDAGKIYVGGQFTKAGEVVANGIAKWDGNRWAPLANGVHMGQRDGVVMTLVVNGGNVYVGGRFTSANEVAAYNIARWDGNYWFALAGGIRGDRERVKAIGISGSDLYAIGAFTTAGGKPAHNIAKWNGRDWLLPEILAEKDVWAIAVSGSDIYLSGNSFRIPGGGRVKGIVRWNGRSWSSLGEEIPLRPITAIGIRGPDVYVVGG